MFGRYLILFIVGPALGLELEGIEMLGGHRYAQLNSKVSLQCTYTLEEGQELDKLGWFRDGIPVLTWMPPDTPVAGLEFREALDLSTTNGSLIFTKVEVGHGGAYTCTVQSKDGKQKSSDAFHMAVADVPSEGFSMMGQVTNCTLHFSFTSPSIFPKPTPLCGVWSTDAEYTGLATDWQAVPYYNGSVAYSIDDTTFNVRSMPLQAGVRCEMSFTVPSGSNSESQKIVAWQNTAYYPEVSERGCPILEVGDGLEVEYKNYRHTCRGELASEDKDMELMATVKCADGLYSSLRGGSVSSVSLTCTGSPHWQIGGNMAWHEFEEMECRETPSSRVVADRVNPLNGHPTEDEDSKENLIDSGAETSSFSILLLPALMMPLLLQH